MNENERKIAENEGVERKRERKRAREIYIDKTRKGIDKQRERSDTFLAN